MIYSTCYKIQLRWLNVKGFDSQIPISISFFNHLKQNSSQRVVYLVNHFLIRSYFRNKQSHDCMTRHIERHQHRSCECNQLTWFHTRRIGLVACSGSFHSLLDWDIHACAEAPHTYRQDISSRRHFHDVHNYYSLQILKKVFISFILVT